MGIFKFLLIILIFVFLNFLLNKFLLFKEKEKIKELYLQEFKKENDPAENCFDVDVKNISKEVISIMRKKGLTYEEAYAVLQYSYNKLKFESNFIHLEELNLEI